MKIKIAKIITVAVTVSLFLFPFSVSGREIGTEEILSEGVSPEEVQPEEIIVEEAGEIPEEDAPEEVISADEMSIEEMLTEEPAGEEPAEYANGLEADGATADSVQLCVYGYNKDSSNTLGKVYTSNTSSSLNATLYTNACDRYYMIKTINTDASTWTVSDTSVVKVTKYANNGAYLTPLKAGSATITATSSASYGSVKGTCRVTVNTGTVPRSVTPDVYNATVQRDASKVFTFSWDPSDSTYRDVYIKNTSGNENASYAYEDANKVRITTKRAGTVKYDYYDGFTNTRRGSISVDIIVAATGVSVSPTSVTLTQGGTKQLYASVRPNDATNKSVTWSSSATGIATVSSSGLVTAVSPGNATITVKSADGSYTASCQVTVNKIPVAEVMLDSTADAVINVGGSVTRHATVSPTNATYPAVTWTSADTGIAVVSNGTVTGKAPGTTTITAKADGKSASFKVTVNSQVTGVSLDKTTTSIVLGESQTLTATVSPADAPNRSVTWTSSYPSIASVDQNGKVTAIYPGRTTITVTTVEGQKKATCTVTVLPVSVTGVSVSKDSATVQLGYTLALTATVYPDNATDKSVRWSSSDESIVSVDDSGLVKGMKLGTADVTVTTSDGNKTAVCRVAVNPVPASQILLNKDEAVLTTGQKKTLIPTVLPEDTTDKSVTWKSSNADIVTVDTDGEICGVAVGSAVITATTVSGHRTAICEVIVTSTGTANTLSYSDNGDGSTGVNGSEGEENGDLVIPGTFRGKKVTTIGDSAFAGQRGITGRLVIPGSITYIGPNAFAGMFNVSVIENNSEEEIPVSSFISEDDRDDVCLVDENGNKYFRQDKIGKGVFRRYQIVKNVEPEPTPTPAPEVTPAPGPERSRITEPELTPTPEPTKAPAPEPTSTPTPVPMISPDPTPVPAVTPVPTGTIEAESITLNKKKVTLVKGKTVKLKATISPSGTTDKTVTWKSSNKKVATDDKNGKVKGKKKGSATITATTKNGKKYKCKVTVKNPVKVKSIKLNRKKATIKAGKTVKLKVTFNPKKPTNKKVTWKTSDKKIATVDKNGKVKGKKKGTATITATSKDGGKKAKCKITVK